MVFLKKKNIRKNGFKFILRDGALFVVALTLCFTNSFVNVSGIDNSKLSTRQIVSEGGENASRWDSDDILVSKKIDGTDTEDVFDITLQVKTKQSVEQILSGESVAVVLAMDLSNTMSSNIDGGSTDLGSGESKAELTVSAAQNFISDFYSKSLSYVDDVIGVVGFNTNGVAIEPLTSLGSEAEVNAMNNDMSDKVMTLLNSYASSGESRRFTNIEAGLKMAKTMLDASSSKHKYIVFLSDGLPTTYTTTQDDMDYTGIDPNGMTDKLAKTLFGTSGTNYYTTQFGTNYSNTGARRARTVATAIKNSGVTIFSIGIGLNTFSGSKSNNSSYPFEYEGLDSLNGQELIMNQLSRAIISRVPTIQNGMDYTWDTGSYTTSSMANRYRIWRSNRDEIYNLHWEIARTYDESTGTYSFLPLDSDTPLFENWLKYSIGSGYYYDAVIDSAVQEAVDGVMGKINEDLTMRQPEVWTTVDPMSAYDKEDASSLLDYIEFQGFLNQNNDLVNSLSGSHSLNAENTANFATESVAGNGEIRWNLKESGFTNESIQGETTFVYTLKYRVRLKVEAPGFVDRKDYDSNGRTTLTYVIKDSQGEVSDNKIIDYPIPVVEGYLVDLKVSKIVDGLLDGVGSSSDDTDFGFTLSLKDSQGQPIPSAFLYDKYDPNDGLLLSNQSIADGETFNLKGNEYVVIHNLYHGINYSVSETAIDGFVSAITSGDRSGVVVSDAPLIEVVFTNRPYRVEIQKIDEINKKPLQDAVFSLYANYQNEEYDGIVINMNGLELSQLKTNESGKIDLGNLDFAHSAGTTYYLKEESAPNMYVLLEKPIEVTIDVQGITAKLDGADLETSEGEGVYTIYVPNERGSDYVEPKEDDIVPETSTQDNLTIRLIVSVGIGLVVVGVAMTTYEKQKIWKK